jgi:hypothetical protein
MQMMKVFTAEQYERALDSWAWIGVAGKEPVFTSLFGDVFFRSADGFWFLDTIAGTLSLEWTAEAELRQTLDSGEGQDRYLLGGLAIGAASRGLELGPDKVYDFIPPPVLSGSFDLDHLVILDFVVAVNIAGQLHQQLKDLPPGTTISGFTIDEG